MKKKILIIAVAACLLALTIAGTSIAYFTDTDAATNVFTVGKVEIQLTEAKVEVDADNWNIVKTSPEARVASTGIDYKSIRTLWPGQNIAKDPRIENIGSEKAYVGAVITVKNVQALLATDEARAAFFDGGAIDDGENTVNWVINGNDLIIFIIVDEALDAKNNTTVDSVDLFTSINIDENWNNDNMAMFADFAIEINAYATQEAGFGDAVTAITTAFPGVFVTN